MFEHKPLSKSTENVESEVGILSTAHVPVFHSFYMSSRKRCIAQNVFKLWWPCFDAA
jgi:hypothetical protein